MFIKLSIFSQLSQAEPWMYVMYVLAAALMGGLAWEILKFIGFILSESFKEKDTKKKK